MYLRAITVGLDSFAQNPDVLSPTLQHSIHIHCLERHPDFSVTKNTIFSGVIYPPGFGLWFDERSVTPYSINYYAMPHA